MKNFFCHNRGWVDAGNCSLNLEIMLTQPPEGVYLVLWLNLAKFKGDLKQCYILNAIAKLSLSGLVLS